MAKKRKAGDGLIRQRADGRWGGGTLSAKLPDILREDGYPDVQAFMRTFREMEGVVEQYNRDLAEWEYQVSRKPTATAKEQHRPPEKQSVLKHLREIQERNKQQPPQRQYKKSIDRDSR